MDAIVGLRVVRGPGDKEGDEAGFVGTVVEVCRKSSCPSEKLVLVQWDTGARSDYRIGYQDDLRVLDSAPTGIKHPGVKCRACRKFPIPGIRWHCLTCKFSIDLCTFCYMADEHNKDHNFERIHSSKENGISVGKRRGTKRFQARGTFPGAIVERGPDWKYQNQDGGKGEKGFVKEITSWKKVQRSAAIVSWSGNLKGLYRLGFNGKIDIICTSEGVGGCYYKEHLPTLVEPNSTTENASVRAEERTSTRTKSESPQLKEKCEEGTDQVLSAKDSCNEELLMDNQEHTIDLNPTALSGMPARNKSDVKQGTTIGLLPQDKHKVSSSESEVINDMGEMLVTAATEGNSRVVLDILDRDPSLIEYKSSGQTPLQQACMSGRAEIVFALLQRGANVQAQDEQGFTALHHACYGDFKAMTASFLLKCGAKIDDDRNSAMTTPLHIAVERHNHECANVLIQKGCNVNVQHVKGDTPLHEAVRNGDIAMVNLLLSSEAVNLHVCNNKGLNPFHLAIKNGFKVALGMVVAYEPDIVRIPATNGMTPLHLAVLNDDVETTELLLETGLCDIKAQDSSGKSATDLATSRPSPKVLPILQRGTDTSFTSAMQMTTEMSVLTFSPTGKRTLFKIGDRVCMTSQRARMLHITPTVQLTVNKVGTVIDISFDGRITCYIKELDNYFWFSPSLLELVDERNEDSLAESSQDFHHLLKTLIALHSEKTLIGPPGNMSDHPSITFFRAVTMCHKSSIRNILDVYPHGVTLAMEGGTGLTGLHIASKVGAVGAVEVLLERGASTDAKDAMGLSPLHHAAIGNRSGKVAELLLNFGAMVNDKAIDVCSATPLHLAVLCSNVATVNVLLQMDCDVNSKFIQGSTALHEAVGADKNDIVKALIASPAIKIKLTNDQGLNAFHLAVLNGNELILRQLLNKVPELVDVRTADDNKMMPLHLACLKCHSGVANILLDTGMCDIHARGCDNRTALAIASSRNMHSIVKRLLEMYENEVARFSSPGVPSLSSSNSPGKASMAESQSSIEMVAPSFYPAFHMGDIVKVNHDLEVVSSLQNVHWVHAMEKTLDRVGKVSKVNKKGKVEVIFDSEGSDKQITFAYHPNALIFVSRPDPTGVPLYYPEEEVKPPDADETLYGVKEELTAEALLTATVTCHLTNIRKILQKKPELVDHRSRGFTALHLACSSGLSTVVKILLDHGANSKLPNEVGLFPLHLSAAQDKSGLSASVLLDHKADVDVNTAETHHLTPLHYAVLSNNEEATKVLIEHKCNPNLKDCQGNTPMHYAINQEKDAIMLAIVQSPTFDPLCRNNSGSNIFHEAVESLNNFALRKLIERCPSHVNEPNSSGLTALHLAVLSNRREVVQLLLQTETVKIDALTDANETPLQLAMTKKFEAMADLLLERGATLQEAQLVPIPQECFTRMSSNDSSPDLNTTDTRRKKHASSSKQLTDSSDHPKGAKKKVVNSMADDEECVRNPGNIGQFDKESFSEEKDRKEPTGSKANPTEIQQTPIPLTSRIGDAQELVESFIPDVPNAKQEEANGHQFVKQDETKED